MKLTFNKIFFGLFASVWAGLILWNLITKPKVFSENENRYLADMPKYTTAGLINGDYMNGIDDYINDQFVLRDQWVAMKVTLEKALLKQDINSVYFAKDDYLIEKHTINDVSDNTADKNRDYLVEFVKYNSLKLGKEAVKVMLIPTASEILTDKLPPFARDTDYNQSAYLDKLSAAIGSNSFIDVRDTLKEHMTEYIYYRTDHHWTSLGAYYAYEKWANDMGFRPFSGEQFDLVLASDQFYGSLHSKINYKIKPDSIYLYKLKEDMNYKLTYNLDVQTDSLYDLDKLNGKDKYSVYMGGNNALVEIKTNNKNAGKLLVIKDSYAHSFVPFAVNHYETSYMVDLRYYNGSINDLINDNGITDILILYNVMDFVKDSNISKLVK